MGSHQEPAGAAIRLEAPPHGQNARPHLRKIDLSQIDYLPNQSHNDSKFETNTTNSRRANLAAVMNHSQGLQSYQGDGDEELLTLPQQRKNGSISIAVKSKQEDMASEPALNR